MKLNLLFLLVAQSASVLAQDLTVTFEPAALPGGSTLVSEWVEDGLHFTTPNGLASNDISNDLYPSNGSAYLQTFSGAAPLTITSVALQPFSFFSVDLAEYSTLFPAPKTVTFLGTLFGGGTVSITFVTDGIIDGNGPLADFETFFFPANFTNLTQVTIGTDTYSMDNLAITIVPRALGRELHFACSSSRHLRCARPDGSRLRGAAPAGLDAIRFAGRFYNGALGLYEMRARSYAPLLGRFTQEDPLGFEGGDWNLYRYATNSPLTFRDPTGRADVIETASFIKEFAVPVTALTYIGGPIFVCTLGSVAKYLDLRARTGEKMGQQDLPFCPF